MTPNLIAQLIVILGPTALEFIPKLAAIWAKPSLSLQEVNDLCLPAKQSYDDYIANAQKILNPLPPV